MTSAEAVEAFQAWAGSSTGGPLELLNVNQFEAAGHQGSAAPPQADHALGVPTVYLARWAACVAIAVTQAAPGDPSEATPVYGLNVTAHGREQLFAEAADVMATALEARDAWLQWLGGAGARATRDGVAAGTPAPGGVEPAVQHGV